VPQARQQFFDALLIPKTSVVRSDSNFHDLNFAA
jgi:hypothetical protein